jgi:VanZ family protein
MVKGKVIPGISNRRKSFLAYAPVFLWIGVIFYLSSSQGSMSETSRIIGPLLHFLFPAASEQTLVTVHGLIRKSAHFTEYTILAYLTVRAGSKSSVEALRKHRFVLAFVLGAVVAIIDEFNQSHDPSRTGSVLDILLDISGGLVLILIMWRLKWSKPLIAEEGPPVV